LPRWFVSQDPAAWWSSQSEVDLGKSDDTLNDLFTVEWQRRTTHRKPQFPHCVQSRLHDEIAAPAELDVVVGELLQLQKSGHLLLDRVDLGLGLLLHVGIGILHEILARLLDIRLCALDLTPWSWHCVCGMVLRGGPDSLSDFLHYLRYWKFRICSTIFSVTCS